jgi:hypothetical protein
MTITPTGTVCWSAIWNKHREKIGLEHLVLTAGTATSVILAIDDDDSPFRLDYQLRWAQSGCLLSADLTLEKGGKKRLLSLHADGLGHWKHPDGKLIPELDGCLDIDIWPTPFTNSFPIWRTQMNTGQKVEFHVAWIDGTQLAFKTKLQAYSKLGEWRYLFESLDRSHFKAVLSLDKDGLVLDFPDLFQRIGLGGEPG